MIRITEKDLFTFVFYSDNLSEEKRLLINENLDMFNAELDFLHNLENNLGQTIPNSILDRIHEKIDSFEVKNNHILEKIENDSDSEYFILAADSPDNMLLPKTETFVDTGKKYMCKIISTTESNKIYLFSNDSNSFLEFKITLLPSKESFIVNKKDMPVIISPKQIVNQVKLNVIN